MNLQQTMTGQGSQSQTQSDLQGSFKQKMAENTANSRSEKGNRIELELSERTSDEEAQKNFDKMLRRPRSRKYMKAIKLLDSLSEGDEMIIAEMKKEAGADENDELVFTPEDIEVFKQRIQETIEEEIRKEEEKRRIEEEKRRMEEDKLRDTLAPCYISGCQIHSITPAGEILEHYKIGKMAMMEMQYRFAKDLIMEHGGTSNYSFVEIYKYRLVHRNSKGDTIKIYRIDDRGKIEK